MSADLVVPTLSNLGKFADATETARATVVRENRRTAEAPSGQRFPSHYYKKWIDACIAYINAGCRGRAFEELVFAAHKSRVASFRAAADGMVKLLAELRPVAARRGPAKILYPIVGESALTRATVHLILTLSDGQELWCYLHFPEEQLRPSGMAIVSTVMGAVVLIENSIIPPKPALVRVRAGEIMLLGVSGDPSTASEEVIKLVGAYRELWDAA